MALAVLRGLSFTMLGPLGGTAYRSTVRGRRPVEGPPPDDWTPASLPPEIAAPTLLVAMTFLAAESSGYPWRSSFPGAWPQGS
jgi:hypothetical protein